MKLTWKEMLFIVFFVASTFTISYAQMGKDWVRDANNPVLSGGASGTWNHLVEWCDALYNADSARYEMWFTAGSQSGTRPRLRTPG